MGSVKEGLRPRIINGINDMPKSKESIIADALGTQEGRAALAEAMVAPIKAMMDYQSIGRKLFHVEPLPPGAPAYYESDWKKNVKTKYVGQHYTPTTTYETGDKMVVAVDLNDQFGMPATASRNPRSWERMRMKHGPYYYPGDGTRWGELI